MKKITMMFCLAAIAINVSAQTDRKYSEKEERTGGFKKENLFTGGSLELGLGDGTTSFGITPYFGYSINKYLDAAISLNYDYVSQRQYYYDYNTDAYAYLGKTRQHAIGPGAFVRIFPVKFLYLQAQYEHNFITGKSLPTTTSGYIPYTERYNVSSFLVGAGLAQGRSREDRSYGYISILFDVAKNPNSPYLDGYGNINPVVRAGYNIALFREKTHRNYGRRRRDRF